MNIQRRRHPLAIFEIGSYVTVHRGGRRIMRGVVLGGSNKRLWIAPAPGEPASAQNIVIRAGNGKRAGSTLKTEAYTVVKVRKPHHNHPASV